MIYKPDTTHRWEKNQKQERVSPHILSSLPAQISKLLIEQLLFSGPRGTKNKKGN